MTFNSYIFVLAFLPIFVFVYFSFGRLNKYASKLLLILGGIIFYAYAGWHITAILGLSLVVNYLLALALKKTEKKTILALAIVFNIGLLFYFKYFNLAIDAINSLTDQSIQHKDLILPLGISFFTFQQIMYVVSVWRGKSDTKIADYLAYVLFFPKLVMGPLMEPTDFFEQLNDPSRKNINWENIARGVKIFSLGLFKKMLLADTFAKAVAWGFTNGITTETSTATATSGDLFLVMLFYTFQIYFDFSGYCDMATGIAKMLNIDLPINFDSPYKSISLREFWRRWHISLMNFLTQYIYIPLGGSRNGLGRTYANIMIVFLISGIWHGSNWTFVLWGCIHGLLLVIERVCKKWIDTLSEVVRWGYTFAVVNILWLLFRADSIANWQEILKTMFSFQDMSISTKLIKVFAIPETTFIFDKFHLVQINEHVRGFGMLLFIIAAFLICLVPDNNYRKMSKINVFNMIVCAIAFIWSFLCLGSESIFVYYNF